MFGARGDGAVGIVVVVLRLFGDRGDGAVGIVAFCRERLRHSHTRTCSTTHCARIAHNVTCGEHAEKERFSIKA